MVYSLLWLMQDVYHQPYCGGSIWRFYLKGISDSLLASCCKLLKTCQRKAQTSHGGSPATICVLFIGDLPLESKTTNFRCLGLGSFRGFEGVQGVQG